jgi:hypothetical protein
LRCFGFDGGSAVSFPAAVAGLLPAGRSSVELVETTTGGRVVAVPRRLEIPGTFMAEKFSVSFQRNLPIRLWISGVSVGGG